jgi:hypothetical protein
LFLIQLQKPQPIFLAFLGISFGKKEEELIKSDKKSTMTDIKAQLDKADQLFEQNKFQDTVDLLKSFDDQSNPEVLWRLGRALFKVSGTESNSSKKSEMIRESYKYISDSLEKDEQNFAVHKW